MKWVEFNGSKAREIDSHLRPALPQRWPQFLLGSAHHGPCLVAKGSLRSGELDNNGRFSNFVGSDVGARNLVSFRTANYRSFGFRSHFYWQAQEIVTVPFCIGICSEFEPRATKKEKKTRVLYSLES